MRAPLLSSAVLSLALLAAPAAAWQAGEPEGPALPEALAEGAVLMQYDVRDLVATTPPDPRGAPAPEPSRFVSLATPTGGLADTPGGLAGLAHLVETYLEPSIEESPARVLAAEGGHLVVLGVREQQDWVADFLRLQREADQQFLISSVLWSAPADALTGLFDEGGEGALVSTALAPADLASVVQQAGGERVTAPRLIVLPRQRASVAVTRQRSYVVGWTLHRVEPDQRQVADPQIEVVDEGVAVEARVVSLPGDRLGLEVAFTAAEVPEPVLVEEVELAEELPALEIALVSQRTTSFSTHLVLADGPVALLAPGGKGDQDVVISLVVEPLSAAELAEPEPAREPEEPVEPGARRGR